MTCARGLDNRRPNFEELAELVRDAGENAKVRENLTATVWWVLNPSEQHRNRQGHSICHMLAERKPRAQEEDLAMTIYRKLLFACAEAGQLHHRNCNNATIVHCAAAQHNITFLLALQEVDHYHPDCVPWGEPGGALLRTPWDQEFSIQKPKNANARRVAEIFCAVGNWPMPEYMAGSEQGGGTLRLHSRGASRGRERSRRPERRRGSGGGRRGADWQDWHEQDWQSW